MSADYLDEDNLNEQIDAQADEHQTEKDKLKEKLRQLHGFSNVVSGLFGDSLSNLELAMQGIWSIRCN